MDNASYAKGLEGVIAAESRICKIDGENAKLYYRGYSVEDLAEHSNFEEVTYLLIEEKLPSSDELARFSSNMRSGRDLAPPILQMIQDFPKTAHPMELLQSSIAYLSGYVKHRIQHSSNCDCKQTLHQVAQICSVIAALYRSRQGEDYIAPRTDLSHGTNFLYMLRGSDPEQYEGEIMDKCLVLHAEHGFNVSTFTARVVASTLSTCYCSISAAMGALFGSLHGGANERVMEMVDAIGKKENVKNWINNALDRKQKIPGMGHRVYKAKDPRATIIENYLLELSEKKNDFRAYEILKDIEKVFRDRMDEKGKPLYPNVDFYSGAVYRLLGIPSILFTPIFAASRTAGWLAHILEQRKDNRLYRPKSLYIGPEPLEYPSP